MHRRTAALFLLLVVSLSPISAAQISPNIDPVANPMMVRPVNRIAGPIVETRRVALAGSRHPLAKPQYVVGEVPSDQRMDKMVMVLRPDAAQEEALQLLLREQQDPASPHYHQWLTPEAFGKRFGISQEDVEQIAAWLKGRGFMIDEIPPSRSAIVFSGTSGQVERAFHTSMRRYRVGGEAHYANATAVEIPQALSEVVHGMVSLHDFRSAPQLVTALPNYTAANGAHFLAPEDWTTIYDVDPVYSQGFDGSGQSIAVLGRVDVNLSDVRTFRNNSGLPPNDPQIITNGADPGYPDCQDEAESSLDVEWAGAIAKNATIKFVTSKSGSTDGINLSAQYAVNHSVSPIVTLSYGLCESAYPSAGNAFWNNLWAQAAAQGMTVFVSSGDSGAAGCDSPDQTAATQGRAVNAICSTPYNTCVGGTQFNDVYNSGQYWSQTNGPGMASALSYIPEVTWNESGWSGMLIASGGGVSKLYTKPAWQSGPGVPADGMRDVPDVALTSAIHDAYIIQIQGNPFYIAGTSAATPSLAGVMALVVESTGSAQGNINPALYALANLQSSGGGAAVFHDITSGNNSVPGVTGYNAGAGYDLATGLGSVDASLLVGHWNDWTSSNFSLSESAQSVAVAKGGSGSLSLSESAQGGFSSPVTLGASGAPAGVSVQFSSGSITPSAPVQVTVQAGSNAVAGSYPISIVGTGGGLSRSVAATVTVSAPSFALATGSSTGTVTAGGSLAVTVSTTVSGGFKSAVALTATGLPKGVTAKFAPSNIASPGSGSSTLTLTAASSTAGGTYTVNVNASGGGVTRTQPLSVTVIVPIFNLTMGTTSVNLTSGGGTATVSLSTAIVNGFRSAVSISATGLPKGITATFAPVSIASPGSGSSTLTLKAAATANGGTFNMTVTASGGGVTRTQTLNLAVTGPTFALTVSGTSISVAAGGSIPLTVTTTALNGFKSPVALSIGGLPKGVTASFSPASIASPGTGTSTLTFKAAKGTAAATASATVSATGGGVTQTKAVTVAVH